MLQFPMKFEVEAAAPSGIGANWTAKAPNLSPVPCAIPVEFMGPGGGYSPEDLFALAVLNCVIALYKVYCEKSKIKFTEIRGRASLTADKQQGSANFVMTQIDMTFEIEQASDPAKAKSLLESAIKDCPVGNSIKSGKTYHIHMLS